MAKTSASMETVVLSKTNEALSEGQRRRQNSVRNNEYAKGYYLFLPMKHFILTVSKSGFLNTEQLLTVR